MCYRLFRLFIKRKKKNEIVETIFFAESPMQIFVIYENLIQIIIKVVLTETLFTCMTVKIIFHEFLNRINAIFIVI